MITSISNLNSLNLEILELKENLQILPKPLILKVKSFPGGASGQESACQCGRLKRCGFDPWVGKIPWRRAWQPTPVFLSGESHGQRN